MLLRGPTPMVEVMVNGEGPFLFAIDTAARGAARLDSSLAARLKLQPVGQIRAGDGSGRNARTLDVMRLDSVELGGIRFRNVDAPTRDYNTSPNLPKIDGILTFNLFAEYLLTLDYSARRVRLTRGELPQADGKEVLSFDSSLGIPVVELGVGGHKVSAHFDTGNAVGAFVLPASLVGKLALASEPVTVGRARTISNDVEIKEARLGESIRLGGHEFARPVITFPSVSEAANIGSKALAEFAVTFDQKNSRMRLEKRGPSKDAAKETAKDAAKGDAKETAARREDSPRADAPGARSEFDDYAGVYGQRTVSSEGGALYLQREGGPKLKLVAAAKDEFTLEAVPEAKIKFVREAGGKVGELHVLNRAGEWEKSNRSAESRRP